MTWKEHAEPFYCELHSLPLPGPKGSVHSQWWTLYLQFRWSLPQGDVGNAEGSVQIQFSIQTFESCKVMMHQSPISNLGSWVMFSLENAAASVVTCGESHAVTCGLGTGARGRLVCNSRSFHKNTTFLSLKRRDLGGCLPLPAWSS